MCDAFLAHPAALARICSTQLFRPVADQLFANCKARPLHKPAPAVVKLVSCLFHAGAIPQASYLAMQYYGYAALVELTHASRN